MYEPPEITEVGTVADLTLAIGNGRLMDSTLSCSNGNQSGSSYHHLCVS